MAIAYSEGQPTKNPYKGYDVFKFPKTPRFVGPGIGRFAKIGRFAIKNRNAITKIGAGVMGAGLAGVVHLDEGSNKFRKTYRTKVTSANGRTDAGRFRNGNRKRSRYCDNKCIPRGCRCCH